MPRELDATSQRAQPQEPLAGSSTRGSEVEVREAREVLTDLLRNRLGKIPSELIAEHVLRIDESGEWPLRRAALEAVARRFAYAKRDELRVLARPQGREVVGEYRTGSGRSKRPYHTRLLGLSPLEASCDCRDFPRASLGLCKHVLVVLDDLARKPRSWAKLAQSSPVQRTPRLDWSPLRPLRGGGDWLERVRLHPPADGRGRRSASWLAIRRKFTRGAAGEWIPKLPGSGDSRKRAALLRAIHDFTRGPSGARAASDPALSARLADELEASERRVKLAAAQRKLGRELDGLARPLFPYQRTGVERFLSTGRMLLADDMGLGKTTQAAAAAQALFRVGLVRRGLLIVPAPLKSQWIHEWQALGDVPIEIVEGGPAERAAAYKRTRRGFLVANYEQVLRDLDEMQAWHPGLVVLDEAQRIKNWATRTAQLVKMLKAPYRLILTGTPMENRLEELASIMDWVDSHALEPKWRLLPWHTESDGDGRGVARARNLDTLRARLEPVLLRRRRTEVLEQLPPRTETTLAVTMTSAQREAHDSLLQPIARLMQASKRRPLTQSEFLRLMTLLATQRVIANGLAQLDFADVWPTLEGKRPSERRLARLDSPKLLEFREIMRALCVEQGRTVVVFSQWRRMLRLAHWAVSDLLEDDGLRSVYFTGRESLKRRTQNLVELHDDPDTRILFASDAGGVGLNLQRAASACINLELPWNPAVLEQRIGRIWRLGQREPVEVYYLVAQDCIEARIASIVGNKRELFDGLFDGTSDTVEFSGASSFLEGVRSVISSEGAPVSEDDPDEPALEEPEQELVTAADESADRPARPALDATEVARLFAGLRVEPTQAGGLRIEAEAEVAGTLASLFEGLASMLRAGAAPSGSSDTENKT